MSILIKGIDLPKNGEEYFFSFEPDGKLYITNYHTGEEITHKGIVEIPSSHGRLIDISTIDLNRPRTFGEIMWEIENAPTILAEE